MYKAIPMLILILCGFCYANEFADNGPVPGELYIIGPDVSPDSTGNSFLYYSSDTGRTLEEKRIWGYDEVLGMAVDKDNGILYACYFTNVHRSVDYGETWEYIEDVGDPHAGMNEGELCLSYGAWSVNYGETFFIGELNGWVPIAGGDADVGVQPGALFVLVYDGVLIHTLDYGEHYDTLYIMPNGGAIRSGNVNSEMFAIIDGQIYYSFNACTSFTVTGYVPSTPGFTYDYCCGWSSGEIFSIGIKYNEIPMEGIFGGDIEIWHSTDAGATWDLLHHYSSSRIYESYKNNSQCEFYSFQNGIIKSETNIRVFDISGKLINSGEIVDIKKYPQGIYFVTNGKRTGKVLLVK